MLLSKLRWAALGVAICLCTISYSQDIPLTYYLPDLAYDPAIPTPESVFGHQVGEWHLSHDEQYMYMRELAAASPRITLTEYARTYEERPLIYLTITTPANHARLEELRQKHVQVSTADGRVDVAGTPAVLYQGFSIHGNEPSGGNAAPLVAYYLAAAPESVVGELLSNTIILFDPCYNPDGFQRFSTWANMHKNANMTADPADREYDEAWPGGRYNHYWFDLNRDWLPVQHPESQGRIRTFHQWKPNVLTDHHEMGTNATFFFMPGEPTRVHPITPKMNQELTGKIGEYHVAALDKIGSLYYSKEGYDDFYYGKGSTYPDANGAIGILFEQASSRGHIQESDNGLLTFPFTVRNQVTTALSTLAAMVGMHDELLTFQHEFYTSAKKEAGAIAEAAYVFSDDGDRGRANELISILLQQQIEVHRLKEDVEVGNKKFRSANTYIVPTAQTQHRLVRAIFETMDTFEDSLFYDISSWTLPLAFNLDFAPLSRGRFNSGSLGERLTSVPDINIPAVSRSDYAYLLSWDDYYAPRALSHILKAGLRAKVTHDDFRIAGVDYPRGTVMIPVVNQDMDAAAIQALMQKVATETKVAITGVATGMTEVGYNLGSRLHSTLHKPEVMMLVGEGVNATDAGEIWHLLDQRYDIVLTKGDVANFSRIDLHRYNTILMVDGSYNSLGSRGSDELKEWVRQGGTLIAMRRAATWAASNGIAYLRTRKTEED